MNTYRYSFQCACLVDDQTITYTIEIKKHSMLYAEDIIAFADSIENPSVQERIADQFHNKFGGSQTITGTHSGVMITTYRGTL